MRTYIGVDYHRAYSYMTAMHEMDKILARGRVANDREAVGQFLQGACQEGHTAAVLEATRNWTVMSGQQAPTLGSGGGHLAGGPSRPDTGWLPRRD